MGKIFSCIRARQVPKRNFPYLRQFDEDLLIDKMSFSTFVRLRQTTQWINNFAANNYLHLKCKHDVYEITLADNDIWIATNPPGNTRKLRHLVFDQLTFLRPKLVFITGHSYNNYKTNIHNRELLLKRLEDCCHFVGSLGWLNIATLRLLFKDEKLVKLAMDSLKNYKLQGLNLTFAVTLLTEIATHSVLSSVRDLYVNFINTPIDINFILAKHGEIYVKFGSLTDYKARTIGQLFKLMSKAQTTTHTVKFQCCVTFDPVVEILGGLDHELIWSREIHRKTVFFQPSWWGFRDNRRHRYYVIPLTGEKIGGVCVCKPCEEDQPTHELISFQIFKFVNGILRGALP